MTNFNDFDDRSYTVATMVQNELIASLEDRVRQSQAAALTNSPRNAMDFIGDLAGYAVRLMLADQIDARWPVTPAKVDKVTAKVADDIRWQIGKLNRLIDELPEMARGAAGLGPKMVVDRCQRLGVPAGPYQVAPRDAQEGCAS